MLARGKTPADVVSCDGCCCYCNLYSLAEYAYREKLSYPTAGLQYPRPPTPYPSIVPPTPSCPTHVVVEREPQIPEGKGEEEKEEEEEEELKALQQHQQQQEQHEQQQPLPPHMHPRIPPDVAMAFLLSLDLLRPIAHHPQALSQHPFESRDALYQALESHLLKHECHRRSSSFGTPGIKVEDGSEGVKEGETPSLLSSTSHPSDLQMPAYQIDGRSHNGEGGGGGTEGGGGGGGDNRADEEELGAFWELLDSELRPIQPMRTCPESLSIFSEHKEMARKYLVLQQELFNLRKHKSVLEEKLSQAEKLEQLGNQRYQDKIRELENKRENLRHTHTKLRQQLEQIRLRQEEQQQRQNQQEDGNGDGIGHNLPLSPP